MLGVASFLTMVVVNNHHIEHILVTTFGCYKLGQIQHFTAFHMAADLPTDLRAYCQRFGIDFFGLGLRCIFCKCVLDIVELAKFYKKGLCLVWRCNTAYAGCSKCLCLSARFEAEKHFQCSAKVEGLPHLLNRPLAEICLRCYYCLGLLDLQEKCDLVARGKPACLVRGYWRAPCRECIDRDF